MSLRCIGRKPDGSPCDQPTFIMAPLGQGLLCREHALEPLRGVFGDRPDLEEKAELMLRFLAMPAAYRHQILEGLTPEDRRETIEMLRLYQAGAES